MKSLLSCYSERLYYLNSEFPISLKLNIVDKSLKKEEKVVTSEGILLFTLFAALTCFFPGWLLHLVISLHLWQISVY